MNTRDVAAVLRQAADVLDGKREQITFADLGYPVAPPTTIPLTEFTGGSIDQRAISNARHRFDLHGKAPFQPEWYGLYVAAGKFSEVPRDLQRKWLQSILEDARAFSPPPAWFVQEFGG